MEHLTILRGRLDAFSELLATDVDLAAPVPSCGDWTLHDLVDHLGQGNLWVVTAVAENRGDHVGEPAPKDLPELRTWFASTADALVDALAADPGTPAWTFTRLAPRTVGFWRRRRMHETLMHLWDARQAARVAEPLGAQTFDPAVAADGVSEVFELFAPRMVERGLASEPAEALRLTASDTGGSWTHGPGDPVVEVSGPVADLLLLLWGRMSSSDGVFAWSGDRAAGERVLAGPLVP